MVGGFNKIPLNHQANVLRLKRSNRTIKEITWFTWGTFVTEYKQEIIRGSYYWISKADKFAIEAEENKNFELLTMSNSLKRAAKDKKSELDNLF